jgi:hypothetical protein
MLFIRACTIPRAVHQCAVAVKGPPAEPQYPLRGSDGRLVRSRACEFLHSNDRVHQRGFRSNQRTVSEVTLPMRLVTSNRGPAEIIDPRNESLTSAERSNQRPQKFRNRTSFQGQRAMARGIVGAPAATVDHCAARVRLLKASTNKAGSSDLPVGRLVDRRVQPPLQKYFASPVGQIISTNSCHPVPHRGAYRDRHERGMGCGGRGSVLRAMGSQGGFLGIRERSPARGREMLRRTAKSCGPDAPTLASSLAEFCLAQPGSDKTISAR